MTDGTQKPRWPRRERPDGVIVGIALAQGILWGALWISRGDMLPGVASLAFLVIAAVCTLLIRRRTRRRAARVDREP